MRPAKVRYKNILILLSLLFLFFSSLFIWRQSEVLLDRLHTRISSYISANLQGEIEWEGVSLFPFNRIVLNQVRVITSDGESLLTMERVVIEYNPLYLLRGEDGFLEGISHVQVFSPTLYLQERDGVFNIEGLLLERDEGLSLLRSKFSLKEGAISFDSQSYGEYEIRDVHGFFEYASASFTSLKLQGELPLPEGVASLKLEGGMERDYSDVLLTLQGLSLSSLKALPYSIHGMTDMRLSFEGPLGKGDLRGELVLREGGLLYQDMSLRSTEGWLTFVREDLNLEGILYEEDTLLSSLGLPDLSLDLLFEGEVLHSRGIETDYRVEGGLVKEEIQLFFQGCNLPLDRIPLPLDDLYGDLHIEPGLGDVELEITGNLDLLHLKGDLNIQEALIYEKEQDLQLEKIQGTISFLQRDLLSHPLLSLSFEALSPPSLELSLSAILEESPLLTSGSIVGDEAHLFLQGEELPLSHLSSFLGEDWEDLRGRGSLDLILEGSLEAFQIEGNLTLQEAGVYSNLYHLNLSQGEGELYFSSSRLLSVRDESLSLEDFALEGELTGRLQGAPFQLLGGYKEDHLHLSLYGEGVELEDMVLLQRDGFEDLTGLCDLHLHLLGHVEDLALSLGLQLREGEFYYLKEDLLFSHLLGTLSLQLEHLSLSSLDLDFSLEDLILDGRLSGLVEGEDFSSTLALEGELDLGDYYLALVGEDLPLSLLNHHLQISPLDHIEGLGTFTFEVEGDEEGFYLSGGGHLREAALDYRELDLGLSQLEGAISFRIERPLTLETDIGTLQLEDLLLLASLTGLVEGEDFSFPLALDGDLSHGDFQLNLRGEDLPLPIMTREVAYPLEVLSGLGSLDLRLTGDPESFYIEGEMDLLDLELSWSYQDLHLHLSQLEGLLSFALEESLSLSTLDPNLYSLEDLQAEGELEGLFLYGDTSSHLQVRGDLDKGLMDLSFIGEDLPLSLISAFQELPEGEILGGLGDLHLSLKGPPLRPEITGDLTFREGEALLREYNVELLDVGGDLSFSLEDISSISQGMVRGHIEGLLFWEERLSPFLVEGDLVEEEVDLFFQGEGLPLGLLAEDLQRLGVDSLEGVGDLELYLLGSLEGLALRGDLALSQGGLHYREWDLSFSSLLGDLTFSFYEELDLLEPAIHLDSMKVSGSLEGIYGLGEEEGPFHVEGELDAGSYQLALLGGGLPLESLSTYLSLEGVESLRGFTDVDLLLEGTRESLKASGDIRLIDTGLLYLEEELSLYGVEGQLKFSLLEEIDLMDPRVGLDSIDLSGSLTGHYGVSEKRGPFHVEGELVSGLYELTLQGGGVPLESLSTYLPLEGVESLTGLLDMNLQLIGTEESLKATGNITLSQVGFDYLDDEVGLSQVKGALSISLKEDIDLEHPSLHLEMVEVSGFLLGTYGLGGEEGPFYVEGRLLSGDYQLTLYGGGLPLESLSTYVSLEGVESLTGLLDMNLQLVGTMERLKASGDLTLLDGGLLYLEEEFSLSQVEGAILFSLSEELDLSDPSIDPDSIDLSGSLTGTYGLGEEEGPFHVEGELVLGLYQLTLQGEGLPLEPLSPYLLGLLGLEGVESLTGLLDMDLNLVGTMESLKASGEISLLDIGMEYPEEDLYLSQVRGAINFSLQEELYLSQPSIEFDSMDLSTSFQGTYGLGGVEGPFTFTGDLREGLYQLLLLGEDLPLALLPLEDLTDVLTSLDGSAHIELEIEGTLESFLASLHVDLEDTKGEIPYYNLSLSNLSGDLSLLLQEPISPTQMPSLWDLHIEGGIWGLYQLHEEEGSFKAHGSLKEELLQLSLKSSDLPLEALWREIPLPQVHDLTGYASIQLEVEGTPRAISLQGELGLLEAGIRIPDLSLTLKEVDGQLSFSFPQTIDLYHPTLSLHQVHVNGEISGDYLLEEERGDFAIEGGLMGDSLDLFFTSSDLPLYNLSSYFSIPEVTSLTGYGDLSLHLAGPLEGLSISGHVELKDGGGELEDLSLALSRVKGPLYFSYKEPLILREDLSSSISSYISSLQLLHLSLYGSLKGLLLFEEEESPIHLLGEIEDGDFQLLFEGTDLPLALLPEDLLGVESLFGYGTGELYLEGDLNSFTLSLQARVREASLYEPSYGVGLSGLVGRVDLQVREPLSLGEVPSWEAEDLHLCILFVGNLNYGEDEGTFSLTGGLEDGLFHLLVEGSRLPLALLPEDLLGVESLSGYGTGSLYLEGDPNSFTLSLQTRVREVSLYEPSYGVGLSDLVGSVELEMKEPLSVEGSPSLGREDLHVEASLAGGFDYRGEEGSISLKGELLDGSLDLFLEGYAFPLALLPEDLFGVDSLLGYASGHLHLLSPTSSSFSLSGEVELKELQGDLIAYPLSFTSLEGDVDFQLREALFSDPLDPLDLHLRGSLSGLVGFQDEEASLSLSGSFIEGEIDARVEGEDLPEDLFSSLEIEGLTSITGMDSFSLTIAGPLDSLSLSGEAHLLEGGLMLPGYSLELSSLDGAISFALDLPLEEDPYILFKKVYLQGDVEGLLAYRGEEGSFSLAGALQEGEFDLRVEGEDLPGHLLQEIEAENLPAITGLKTMNLKIRGDVDAITLSGGIGLEEGDLYLPQYNLSLFSLSGHLSFHMEEPWSIGSPLPWMDLHLSGDLKGDLSYREEVLPFHLGGEFKDGFLALSLLGEELPLSLLPEDLLVESLHGMAMIEVELLGELEDLQVNGVLDLREAGMDIPSYPLSLSSLDGYLFFALHSSLESFMDPSSISLEDLDLSGSLEGEARFLGEETRFTMEGVLLQGFLDLSLEGQDSSLYALFSELDLTEEFSPLGLVDFSIHAEGELDSLSLSGDVQVEEASLELSTYPFSLSSLEGDLSFSLLSPLSLFDPRPIRREDLMLQIDLEGLSNVYEEEISLALQGEFCYGDLHLHLEGMGIPLGPISQEMDLTPSLSSGEGHLNLWIEGNLDAFYLFGEVELSSLSLYSSPFSLSSIDGEISFTLPTSLSLDSSLDSLALEDFMVWGELEGDSNWNGESSPFTLSGHSLQGDLSLKLDGRSLPLEMISSEMDLPLSTSLSGEVDVGLNLHGHLDMFHLSGDLTLSRVDVEIPSYVFSLSSIEGGLSFVLDKALDLSLDLEDLSLEDLSLWGHIEGFLEENEKRASFALKGSLREEPFYLDLSMEEIPLPSFSSYLPKGEYELLGGEGELSLYLLGSLDLFSLEGTLGLKNLSLDVPLYHLSILKGEGEISIDNREVSWWNLADDLLASSSVFSLIAGLEMRDGEISPLMVQGSLEQEDLSLEILGERLSLVSLSQEGSRFLEEDLPLEVKKGEVDLHISLLHSFQDIHFKDLHIEGWASLRDSSFYLEEEDLLFEEVGGDLHFFQDELTLSNIRGQVQGAMVGINGKVRQWDHLDLEISFSSFKLELLEEYVDLSLFSGLSNGSLTLFGEMTDPLLYGHVGLQEVYLLDYYLPEASFNFHYRQGRLNLIDVWASLFGGTLTGSGNLDLNGAYPLYAASLEIEGLSSLHQIDLPGEIEGSIGGELILSGAGTSLEDLNVLGSLELSHGSIMGYDVDHLYTSIWLHKGTLHLSRLDLELKEGTLEGNGTIDLTGELDMYVESPGFYLGDLFGEDLIAKLDGRFTGFITDPTFTGEVALDLEEWGELYLEGEASRERISIKRGGLRGFEEEIALFGTYGPLEEDLDLVLTLSHVPLEEIISLLPEDLNLPEAGEAKGEVSLTGDLTRPSLEGSISFTDFHWEGEGLEEISFHVVKGGEYFFIHSCQLHLAGGWVDISGDISTIGDFSLYLGGQGFSIRDLLSFSKDLPEELEDLQGDLDFHLLAYGSPEEWELDGFMRGEDLTWRDLSVERIRGDFLYKEGVVDLSEIYLYQGRDAISLEGMVDLERSTLKVSSQVERLGSSTLSSLFQLEEEIDDLFLKGELLLTGPFHEPIITCDLVLSSQDREGEIYIAGDLYPREEELLLHLRAVDFSLKKLNPFLPLDSPLSGYLTFTGDLTGTISSPYLSTYDLSIREAGFGEYRAESIGGDFHLKEGQEISFHQVISIQEMELYLSGDFGLFHQELDLHLLSKDADLAFLAPFIPQLEEARGGIHMDLFLQGTLSQPQMRGEVEFEEAFFSFDHDLLSPFTDVQGSILFSHYFLDFSEVRGYYGEGPFQLRGEMGLSGFEIIHLSLSFLGESLPFVYEDLKAYFYPDLKIEGSLSHPLITGEVGLANTRVPLPIHRPEGIDTADWNILVDINIQPKEGVIGEHELGSLVIDRGELRLENLSGDYLLIGELFSQQGTFNILNNTFQLEEGKATFTRFYPNMPRVEGRAYTYLTAERRIFVHAAGLANDPQFAFSAENGMTQEEIIAGLAGTGDLRVMQGDLQDLTGDLWRFIAQTLRLDIVTQLEDALARTFELDEVLILQDREENIELRVGKFVIDDLYLTYRRTLSATAHQQMGFEYRLNPYARIGGTLHQDGEFRLMLKGSWPF